MAGPQPQQAGKRKKGRACDRCRLKRVLCHPAGSGCPRCLEKGFDCTTTVPTSRRKPTKRASTPEASSAPALVALQSSQPSSSMSTPTLSSRTPPLGAHSDSTPTSSVFEITPSLTKHLFDIFAHTSQATHPILLSSPLHDKLDSAGWDVNVLPLPAFAQAFAVFAVAALLSPHPSIIGEEALLPSTLSEVADYGPDLRAFGRRRASMQKSLKEAALRYAGEAEVLLHPTLENAATAMLLDSISDTDDEPPASRPYYAIYLSHLRALVETGHEAALVNPVRFGAFFVTESLAELAQGRLSLSHADEILLVGKASLDLPSYARKLTAILQRPADRSGWPDMVSLSLIFLKQVRELWNEVLGAHAQRQDVDEVSLTKHLKNLHSLRSAAGLLYTQILDRLLIPYGSFITGVFPGTSNSKLPPRAFALNATRTFATFAWTSFSLPFYREVQRRCRILRESAASSSDDPTVSLEAERLEFLLRQARDLVFLSLAPLADIAANAPIAYVALVTRRTIPSYAAFAVEEIEAGTALLDERLHGMLQSFLTGLHHHGYVFSTPATDDLILRLEALLLSFSPSADPLAFLHAIDTPPQYPATSFTSTDLPIPPTNAFLSGSSLLPASDPTLTVNAEVADYGRIISEAISGAASASDWSGAAGGGSFSDGGGVGPEAESMHAWAPW